MLMKYLNFFDDIGFLKVLCIFNIVNFLKIIKIIILWYVIMIVVFKFKVGMFYF